MTNRAAEMAQLMMERWDPSKQSAREFAEQHFGGDTIGDLEHAIGIMAELEAADDIADDWFKSRRAR